MVEEYIPQVGDIVQLPDLNGHPLALVFGSGKESSFSDIKIFYVVLLANGRSVLIACTSSSLPVTTYNFAYFVRKATDEDKITAVEWMIKNGY